MNDHFFALSLLFHLNQPGEVIITINNSAIIIIFKSTSKSLAQKLHKGIAFIFSIEIVSKEVLKYEVENIRWGYTIDEHGWKGNNISQSQRKGPMIWQSRFTLVLLQVVFYVRCD